jgi:hypothetical protein
MFRSELALTRFSHPIVMEIAVLLAGGMQDWIDFGVIIGILMLNAVVGWYQEKSAADVVASLKGDIALRATVIRDGQEQEIKARELVPGDIVSRSYPIIIRSSHILTNSARSSSKMDMSFRPMPALSAITRTKTVTPSTSENWNTRTETLYTNTEKMMMKDTEANTVPDMPSSQLINLP